MNYLSVFPTRITTVIIAILVLSCNKYLDVKPEDKFLDAQVYGTEASVKNALNGIYLNMAKPALYGENLSTTTVDVLARYYNISSTAHKMYTIANYNYADDSTRKRMTDIWYNAYQAILNINAFIYNVSARNDVMAGWKKNLMLGEAYGLRAFISLDMLRLFGPVYARDSAVNAIPYPVLPATEISALLPAKTVMDSVMSDLDKAKQLLLADPIITNGVQLGNTIGSDPFFLLRNRRMNYYSVLALQARTLLYRGNKQAALQAALQVMEQAGKWFPWVSPELTTAGNANADRVFSSEVLFGVENYNMFSGRDAWFNATLPVTSLLIPHPQYLNNVYENYTNDYRFRSWWKVDNSANLIDRTFFKYADITDKTLLFRRLQPLLRMSEMYYIAAECAADDATATGYLNTMRLKRGLPDVLVSGNRQLLITREFQKEFWGEGQLFYYYKRTNSNTIPNGTSASGTINMTAAQYVVPLPAGEVDYR